VVRAKAPQRKNQRLATNDQTVAAVDAAATSDPAATISVTVAVVSASLVPIGLIHAKSSVKAASHVSKSKTLTVAAINAVRIVRA